MLRSESEMESLGAVIAGGVANWWSTASGDCTRPASIIVFLQGELGAGKTTIARGLLRELGVRGPVKSPTYTLLESYDFELGMVYHCDCYRIRAPGELEDAGFRDLLRGGSVWLVEWPDRAGSWFPEPDLRVSIEQAEDGRRVQVVALSEPGQRIYPRDPAGAAL